MNMNRFDLNLLRVLDALLRERSVTRAAHRVGLSQPAVSTALARLRALLDDPILVRHGQRLEPTTFALSLAVPLHEALGNLHDLLAGADGFDPATANAVLKLSGSDFFAELLMVPLAQVLSRAAPGICVQMVDLVPDNYVGTLERYEVDVALIPGRSFPEWSAHQPIFQSDFVTIARKGHPRLDLSGVAPGQTIPLDLYCDLGHVLFSPEGKTKALGDSALARIDRTRRVVMTMPAFSGIFRVISQSDHLALVPRQIALAVMGLHGLSVYRQPMDVPPATISMVWHRRTTNSPVHRWFRSILLQTLTPLEARSKDASAPPPT